MLLRTMTDHVPSLSVASWASLCSLTRGDAHGFGGPRLLARDAGGSGALPEWPRGGRMRSLRSPKELLVHFWRIGSWNLDVEDTATPLQLLDLERNFETPWIPMSGVFFSFNPSISTSFFRLVDFTSAGLLQHPVPATLSSYVSSHPGLRRWNSRWWRGRWRPCRNWSLDCSRQDRSKWHEIGLALEISLVSVFKPGLGLGECGIWMDLGAGPAASLQVGDGFPVWHHPIDSH